MTKRTWTIGSSTKCDLVVENKTVSGQHCRLDLEGEKILLTDLKSTNGTYVNGVRLDGTRTVSRFDQVTLGKTQPMPWPESLLPAGEAQPADAVQKSRQEQQVVTIGRSPENDVVINETNVSSFHARVVIGDGKMEIEDLGSTNGTSVGKVQNKIRRSAVEPNDKIFFGSKQYLLADLLADHVGTTPSENDAAPSQPVVPPSNQTQSLGKKPILLGAGTAIALALVGVIAFIMMRPGGGEMAADTSGDEREEVVELPEPSPSEADDDPGDEVAEVALSPEEKLARSLYLVVCSDSENQVPMRVGTAFAIDDRHLATSANVLLSMKKLQSDSFPDVSLFCPATGEKLGIVSSGVHPEFVETESKFQRARQTYDDMMDRLEQEAKSEEPDPEVFEKARQPLIEAQTNVLALNDRMTSFDVGVIEVDQTLSHWLEGAAKDSSMRPKLKLNVSGYAIDHEDRFFDASVPFDVMTMSARIQALQQATPTSTRRLLVDATQDQLEYDFLGSPALNAQGKVLAVYSRATPPEFDNEAAKPADTFDAPLFQRVRECLEAQP